MSSNARAPFTLCVAGLVLAAATPTFAAVRAAADCSLNSVQAAVNASIDGDKVLIPNGSCTWTGGINTTKQIRIEAQNYTPTKGGTMTRGVTITNNSASTPLISLQSGNSYHVGIGGIRFNEGAGNANAVRFSGTGNKVPLLYDCAFQTKSRFGSSQEISVVAWLAQGGVAWNVYMDGSGFGSGSDPGPSIAAATLVFDHPRAWKTPSTMGALDTDGTVNVYVEDSTFLNTGGGDLDNNSRVVARYNTFDGSVWTGHGFTSPTGSRHFESYNNTYKVSAAMRNHGGRYVWIRAGTAIFTDNTVNGAAVAQNYGDPALLVIGEDGKPPTQNPQYRQPGWGHDGTRDLLDPIYIWGNAGARGSAAGIADNWAANLKFDRELYLNRGAKPGYAKYTYPHPARAEGGAAGGGSLPIPSNLRLQ